MMVNGLMEENMEEVRILLQIKIIMKAILIRVRDMEKEFILGLIKVIIKGLGIMTV